MTRPRPSMMLTTKVMLSTPTRRHKEHNEENIMRDLFRYLIILICCGLPIFSGASFAERTDSQTDPAEHQHEQASDIVWTCSMHPQIQLPEPGQCPICFMDLIEVEKRSNEDRLSLRQISLDSQARKLAEIEVQPVTRGNKETDATVQIFGRIDYDETRMSTITSWVDGRIDKLFVDYTGAGVQRGQAVAEVYSPDLFTAQASTNTRSAAPKFLLLRHFIRFFPCFLRIFL